MPTPIFNPYMPQINESLDQRVKSLTNAYIDLVQQYQYLLTGHLDDKNVQSITTDKLIAGTALIDTALITTLIVGTNVGQGSAPRSFTAEPTTPYSVGDVWTAGPTGDLKRCITARATGAYNAADWQLGTNYTNPTGVTTIVGGVITTDYVNALNVTAGSVAAENITGTNITGKKVRTAASGARVELGSANSLICYNPSGQKHGLYVKPDSSVNGYADVLVYRNDTEMFSVHDNVDDTVSLYTFGHSILYGSNTTCYPMNTWNFTNATVTNLYAKFG